MGFIFRTVKKGFLWSYERTTWQWDVLCVVILVFIFLTPKSWFENTEFQRSRMAEKTERQVLVLSPDLISAQPDTSEIERRVRTITGRADARVTNVVERRDSAGKIIGYEVDFR
jgi:hypothetical protein